jgi:signal transduction histidine kinase
MTLRFAPLRNLPLRVRLTLWYSLVFAAALFGLGFACLWMVHSAVTNIENNELQQRVKSVRQFLEARPAGETHDQLRKAFAAAYDVYHGHKWLQVIDENGVWAYRSSHVANPYPDLLLPQQTPATANYFTYTAEGLHVRALIQPIQVNGVRYTVQTGLTLDKALIILSNFRAQLALLIALGLVVSSLAGYFMSRKALTPIAAIASEAHRINDKNLNVRLPALQTRDELAVLSDTLNQMLGRIDAGYQSVRSFTANAAHELRSPVALLRAEVEVALAFPRDTTYLRNACERVLANSVQMGSLVDQLLALARADAGVELLHLEPVNLPDLLEEAASEWSPRFAQAQIRFRCEAGPSEFWVDADYLALKRLIHILLENAWRYTPTGESVTLTLQIESSTSARASATISILDTGIGIAPEDQARIFERFCRIARPFHGEFSGSGLGLVLAQWIAQNHRSTIQVHSSPGSGSRFSFLLPISLAEQKQPIPVNHGIQTIASVVR